jgi:hypothetical protein
MTVASVKLLTPEEMKIVDDNIRKMVELAVAKNECTLVDVKKNSNHPDDYFLYDVIAERENKYSPTGKEYITWLFNAFGGLNYGHYNIWTEEEGRKDWLDRAYIV